MIAVDDLLGRTHEPLRCIGYVMITLGRCFQDFVGGEIPVTREEAEAWLQSSEPRRWREVGRSASAAKREGDVAYCSGGPDGAYIAVLVDERGGGFLTSNKARGCHIRPRRLMTDVISVQRRV